MSVGTSSNCSIVRFFLDSLFFEHNSSALFPEFWCTIAYISADTPLMLASANACRSISLIGFLNKSMHRGTLIYAASLLIQLWHFFASSLLCHFFSVLCNRWGNVQWIVNRCQLLKYSSASNLVSLTGMIPQFYPFFVPNNSKNFCVISITTKLTFSKCLFSISCWYQRFMI